MPWRILRCLLLCARHCCHIRTHAPSGGHESHKSRAAKCGVCGRAVGGWQAAPLGSRCWCQDWQAGVGRRGCWASDGWWEWQAGELLVAGRRVAQWRAGGRWLVGHPFTPSEVLQMRPQGMCDSTCDFLCPNEVGCRTHNTDMPALNPLSNNTDHDFLLSLLPSK